MKLLIDGDVLAYRAGFATDKTRYCAIYDFDGHPKVHYFDTAAEISKDHDKKHVWNRKDTEPEDKALMLIDVMIGDIRAHYQAENPSTHIFLSGVGNYRHGIATRATYKGNRAGRPQPTHFKAIREHLLTKWSADLSQGEEADDRIGIEATKYRGGCVVCSIDKDLRQLPGRHYDFTKKEETTVTPKEAVLNLYSQVISGDSTDNVPGATGFGPVRAKKALEGCKSPFDCWQAALGVYVKEWGDLAGPLYALEAARLVYVRRKEGEIFNAPEAPKKLKAA